MKVKINTGLCKGTAFCEKICPLVFKTVQGVSQIRVDNVPPEAQVQCKIASQNCPNNAISIEVRELVLYPNKTGGVL